MQNLIRRALWRIKVKAIEVCYGGKGKSEMVFERQGIWIH